MGSDPKSFLRPNEIAMFDLVEPRKITDLKINRRSDKDFDFEYSGKSDWHFVAWFPLKTLREAWGGRWGDALSEEIEDYVGDTNGDWSVIRDSDEEDVWCMFNIVLETVVEDLGTAADRIDAELDEANYGRWALDWGIGFDDAAEADQFWFQLGTRMRDRENHVRRFSPKLFSCATRDSQRRVLRIARELNFDAIPNIDEPGERKIRHAAARRSKLNTRSFIDQLSSELDESDDSQLDDELYQVMSAKEKSYADPRLEIKKIDYWGAPAYSIFVNGVETTSKLGSFETYDLANDFLVSIKDAGQFEDPDEVRYLMGESKITEAFSDDYFRDRFSQWLRMASTRLATRKVRPTDRESHQLDTELSSDLGLPIPEPNDPVVDKSPVKIRAINIHRNGPNWEIRAHSLMSGFITGGGRTPGGVGRKPNFIVKPVDTNRAADVKYFQRIYPIIKDVIDKEGYKIDGKSIPIWFENRPSGFNAADVDAIKHGGSSADHELRTPNRAAYHAIKQRKRIPGLEPFILKDLKSALDYAVHVIAPEQWPELDAKLTRSKKYKDVTLTNPTLNYFEYDSSIELIRRYLRFVGVPSVKGLVADKVSLYNELDSELSDSEA